MITVDDFYKEIRECTYKGEVYSVRETLWFRSRVI